MSKAVRPFFKPNFSFEARDFSLTLEMTKGDSKEQKERPERTKRGMPGV
jgi:hypothetical protein